MDNIMPKVSVIVPIYGVEQYIERCARSLFEQTFTEIEYIFVNDCTKDASVDILFSVIEQYPHRQSQIKVLHHQENKGLPQARTTGILAASGDFIINFDSDDWVDITIIEVLYKKAIEDKTEIVICDFYNSDGINHRKRIGGNEKWNISEYFEKMCKMNSTWAVWNKLIKRTLFEGVTFPIYNNGEDMALILQLVAKAEKISYVSSPLYFYYVNPQSMTRVLTVEQVRKNVEERISNNEIVFQVFKKIFPLIKCQKYREMFKWHVKKIAWRMYYVDRSYYVYWKSVHSDINLTLFFNSYIKIEDKFKCLLTHLRIYPRGNK